MKQEKEIPDNEQERQYIRETIVKRKKRHLGRKVVFFTFFIIILSSIAGVIFAISNCWARTKIEKNMTFHSEEPFQTIPETETSAETKTEPEDPSEKPEVLALEQAAFQQASKSIVTISITEQSVDWFDTELEQVEETFGVVIDIVNNDILILTNAQDVDNNGSIAVKIGTEEVPATVEGICHQDNIALVVVNHEDARPVIGKVEVIPIGDSSQIELGDRILLAGSPLGYANSVLFGMITYIDQSVTVADGAYQMFYTNIHAPINSSGFLLNTNGELVGWINESYKKTDLDDYAACIGMNDIAYVLESIRSGKHSAMLGAQGMDITDEIRAQIGISNGFFLVGVLNHSPAYTSGMQNGDIIVAVDEKEVNDTHALRAILNGYEAGDSAEITVMRKGKDSYRKIRFNIIFAER